MSPLLPSVRRWARATWTLVAATTLLTPALFLFEPPSLAGGLLVVAVLGVPLAWASWRARASLRTLRFYTDGAPRLVRRPTVRRLYVRDPFFFGPISTAFALLLSLAGFVLIALVPPLPRANDLERFVGALVALLVVQGVAWSIATASVTSLLGCLARRVVRPARATDVRDDAIELTFDWVGIWRPVRARRHPRSFFLARRLPDEVHEEIVRRGGALVLVDPEDPIEHDVLADLGLDERDVTDAPSLDAAPLAREDPGVGR